jgi:uncharacterized membrane protein YebE (DUF533 family)
MALVSTGAQYILQSCEVHDMALNDKLINGMKGDSGLNGALWSADGGVLLCRFTRKRDAHTLLRTGGVIAIARLAWQAYSSYRLGQQQRSAISPQAIPRQRFEEILNPEHGNPSSGLVLQAMIAGAQVDQRFSQFEQTQIWQCAMDLGATGSELAAITETMANPPSIDDLVCGAKTLETEIEVYLASFMVIDEQGRRGQTYLRRLARRLRLPPLLVEALESPLQSEPVAA